MPPNVTVTGVLPLPPSGSSKSSLARTQQPLSPHVLQDRITTVGQQRAHEEESSSCWEVCSASAKSKRTTNPIRAIVDPIVANSIKSGAERGDGKDQISLALGDPTVYGNLPPCPAAVSAITRSLTSSPVTITAGYVNACGTPEAREAIAKYHSYEGEGIRVTPDDVIVANGCSGALELALTALLDEDTVLLVPRPGFPLYQVIAESHGARVVHYDLIPDRGWEVDLSHVEELLRQEEGGKIHKDGQKRNPVVRGIVINNPSNPTGGVYSEQHLMDILDLANRYHIPIVADEIYGDMTYGDDVKFHPLAKVAAKMGRNVPIISASGLGKQYLLPGWRVGWIVFHDNNDKALREVQAGAKCLAQVILGASHLAQCAIPAVLTPSTPAEVNSIMEWRANLKIILTRQASFTYDTLSKCHGLSVIKPQGAMYVMVKIDTSKFDTSVKDDMSFTKLLLDEENVFVLPGKAFGTACSSSTNGYNVFRVVFCAPEHVLSEAFERIGAFCKRHAA